MRVFPRTSVGIEIAGDDLRIAVVRSFAHKRRLLRTDVLTGFSSLSDEDRQGTLITYFKRHRLSHFSVHLTLPSTSGVTRDIEFPAAIRLGEDLRSAVALQVENLSPWALDEVYWDCAWEPPGKGIKPIVVHVAIVPREVLDPWILMFRSAAVALTGASLSSLAWAHGVSALWGTEQPTVVLATESSYVEGAFVRDDRVHVVSMAGDSAELTAASASQLMRLGRVESLNQVRLVGHGASSNNGAFESVRLPLDGGSAAAPAFGAISTALLGLVRSGFQLNLVPDQLRYQRNYLQMVPTYTLVALILLCGVFALLREPYQQSLYASQLDREAQRLAVEVRSVADQEAQLNRDSDRLTALNAVVRSRDANLETIRELSRLLPQDTWLSSYSYQDNVATITGLSASAATIQRILEDSAIFRDAQFTSSITRDPSGKDRFVIRASIEGVR